jgi:outer membrane lipoprotein-sorting protein
MKTLLLLATLLVGPASAGTTPTATELLHGMDKNLQTESRTATMTMTVTESGRARSYKMRVQSRGKTDSAVEYLEPEREKGNRMLKEGDQLWLYLARGERVQKVSGHMMREGMMGSDVSYEDLMASADFEAQYEATVTGQEPIDGRSCWKIEAKARDNTVSYPKRIIWVDAQTLIPARQELYALSGMLLKTWTMTDVKDLGGGRMMPMRMEIADKLREGSSTVIVTDDIQLGVKLSDEVFSMRWLERGN